MRRYVVVCAVLCASLLLAAPAAGSVRDCPDNDSRDNVANVSARNMSCASALRQIRRVRYIGGRARLPGWRCRIVERSYDGVQNRCSRGAQAFRWYIGG